MTGARPQPGGPRPTGRPCRRCRRPGPDCECTAIELGATVRWHEMRAALIADYLRAHKVLTGGRASALDRSAAAADKASAADALARLLVAAGEARDFGAASAAIAHGRLPELADPA